MTATTISSSNLPSFELPKFHFTSKLDRWATARATNVSVLKKMWEDEPQRIEVLDDPKFKEESLVILNKKRLEELLETSENLKCEFDKNIRTLNMMMSAIDVLSNVQVENQNLQLKSTIDLLSSMKKNLSFNN